MGKPQVTLTLAGDASKLEQTFGQVGASSKKLADDVGASSKRIAQEGGDGFDRAGEAADTFDTRSMGARDGITGIQDTMTGFSALAQGDYVNGLLNLGSGFSDIGSSLYNFVIPSLKNLTKATVTSAAQTVRNTAATAASKAAQLATAAASKTLAAGQYLVNAAMRANPIGLIITALTLLAGGLIYAYKHSEKFRNIVNGALGAVKSVAQSALGWITKNWSSISSILLAPFNAVIKPIWKNRDAILNAFKAIPGAIGGFFKKLGGIIAAPFQAAFSAIRNFWNNNIGGKGFTVPGWIPEIGGKEFRIPYFHTGGIVSGAMGSESLAVLKAGERVTGGRNSGGGAVIVLRSDGGRIGKLLIQILREAIKIEGGDVQVVLGK
jgi:hypothetical protein